MEGHELRVFENRVLRKVLGHKREELRGNWRTLHNKELMICALYQIRMGGQDGRGMWHEV